MKTKTGEVVKSINKIKSAKAFLDGTMVHEAVIQDKSTLFYRVLLDKDNNIQKTKQ
jgi:hypothetical protein